MAQGEVDEARAIRADITMRIVGHMFSRFCQSCSLRLRTGTHPVFGGIAQRPSVVRSTFTTQMPTIWNKRV